MPIPSTVADLSTTASSNYPSGSESANQLDDYHRALCSIVRQVSDAKEDSGVAAAAITAERTAVATLTNKTLVAPALGTPASGNLANCTFPTLNQNTTGTAAGLSTALVAGSGGTGLTSPGTSGNVLTSNGTAWTSAAPSNTSPIKAWVDFDGTGSTGTNQTIKASSNVSSVYKNATGDYTINFTSALSSANYCMMSGSGIFADGTKRGICYHSTNNNGDPTTKTTTAVRIYVGQANTNAAYDTIDINCVFVGA